MKVLSVKKHFISGDTDVSLEVPEFENFGNRYEELERLADEAHPIDPEEVRASTARMMAQVQAQREEAHKKLEEMPAGPKKEMHKMMLGMMDAMAKTAAQAQEESDEPDADEDEESDTEAAEPETRNPHLLDLSLPRKIKWNKETQAMLEKFFAEWAQFRAVVLQAVFDHYKGIYPELAEVYENHKGRHLLYPEPTSPDAIADIFYFQSAHLHDDGSIGLSGHCTWDEEHGFGLVLREGKITDVGSADVAF